MKYLILGSVVALVGVNCIEVRKQNAMHDEFTTVSD
jgi:hypothetical protein